MRTLSDYVVAKGIQTGPFGSQLHAYDYVESGIGVVMPQDLGENMIIQTKMARISRFTASVLSRHRLIQNDIVYSRRGDVTRRSLVRETDGELICGTGCLRVRLDPERADAKYVSYALGLPETREWIVRHAVGATMANLNTQILSAIPLSLPELTAQTRIGEVLGALDDKIVANQSLMDAAQDWLRARWDQLTTSSNRVLSLQELAEISPRVPASRAATPPYLDMKNLPEHGLLVSDWGHRESSGGARFKNGDTLLARITPCFENGKIAWVDFLGADEIGYGSTEYIVFRAQNDVPPVVPYLIAASSRFRAFAAQHRTGTSGRQRVQAGPLGSYQVPVPEAGVLAQFGEDSEALLEKSGAVRSENRALAATRDELLPLLMSGKITVKDAEKRVEQEV